MHCIVARITAAIVIMMATAVASSVSAEASAARLYFSSDSSGIVELESVCEGEFFWIVVEDGDENNDCDVRDKIWADVDVAAGCFAAGWVSYGPDHLGADGNPYDSPDYVPYEGHFPGTEGSYDFDFLEETASDSGVFVSCRPFQLGTRESHGIPRMNTHVLDDFLCPGGNWLHDFHDDLSAVPVLPEAYITGAAPPMSELVEPLDATSLKGTYTDPTPGEEDDRATANIPLCDVSPRVEWDQSEYFDANGAATLIVAEADENMNCDEVEYVPVFLFACHRDWEVSIDCPGCDCIEDFSAVFDEHWSDLRSTGGVNGETGDAGPADAPIEPYNAYHSEKNAYGVQGAEDGKYYYSYPDGYDTLRSDGVTVVLHYAQETGADTGVFEVRLNSILVDLGFRSLPEGSIVRAHYMDPTHGGVASASAAIEGVVPCSTASFVDSAGHDVSEYAPDQEIYVHVTDPSHSGAFILQDALEFEGCLYDLIPLPGDPLPTNVFSAGPLQTAARPGEWIEALYRDPDQERDCSLATARLQADPAIDEEIRVAVSPNPLTASTTFVIQSQAEPTEVVLRIFDLSGNEIWSERDENTSVMTWNATDHAGNSVARGAYIYRMEVTTPQSTATMLDTLVVK